MAAEALTHRLDPCPDAETLAAYLDGRLTQDEREDLTAHVADCEACYFVVTEIAQTATARVNVEGGHFTRFSEWRAGAFGRRSVPGWSLRSRDSPVQPGIYL